MKIRFVNPPTYVCEHQVRHHDALLAAFVGLELQAELAEGGEMYRAELAEVLRALTRPGKDNLLAIAYWSSHWLRVKLMLHEYVYFPASCCQVITPSGGTPCHAASLS